MDMQPPDSDRVDTARSGATSRRRWLGFLAGLLAAALLAAGGWWTYRWWSTPAPPELPAGIETAVRDHLERLRAKVQAASRAADAWGELGMGLFGNGLRELALPCFVHAEHLDPEQPEWPHLQAIEHHLADNLDEAIACLERAVPNCDIRDPHNFVPRLLLAELQLARYQDNAAEAHARWVLDRNPKNERAHYLLGVIAAGRDQAETSLQHLAQAAASPFARKRAYQQLAAVHRRLNQVDLAQQFIEKANRLPGDPDWPDPYYLRAMQHVRGSRAHWQRAKDLRREGKVWESLRYFRGAADETSDPSAQIALGKTLLQLGDLALAESVLRAAVRQQPDLAQAHQQLSVVLLEVGETLPEAAARVKFEEARAAARKALDAQPRLAAAHWALGLALRRLGQKDEAIAELAEAVRLRPELYQHHLHLGEALAETGRLEEGLRHLRVAVDMAPSADRRPAAALERWQAAGKP